MIDYLYLQIQNPWWENKSSIEEDEKIKEFKGLKYRYTPKQILSIPPVVKNIHIISGPRQTGKSTALKLYIKQCLGEGVNPQNIMYFNCDALSNEKDVIDLILEFNKTREKERTIVLLDEISSVANWPQGIKWLADAGQLKNTALFLTGSSSINLKKSGEMLPGRRGRGKDVNFLPISFYDYLTLKGVEIEKIRLNTSNALTVTQKFMEKTKKHYTDFIGTGGFLRNINYGLTEETGNLYLQTLKSELFKNGKKEDSLREVVKKILNSLSAQTSYTNIAEEAELGSKNTAIDYLGFLTDSYFLSEIKFYDIPQQKVLLKKNKKFYTTDPYVVWLFQGFVIGSLNFDSLRNLVDDTKLAENFVATELTKKGERFYFHQNSNEMDFYLPKENIGMEVKYKNKIINDDIKFPNGLNKKIIISKSTLEKRGDVFIIPVHLFSLFEL